MLPIDFHSCRIWFLLLIDLAVLMESPPNSSDIIESFDDPMQIVEVTTGEYFMINCSYTIHKRFLCQRIGPDCEVKFDWMLPMNLLDDMKRGNILYDGRIHLYENSIYHGKTDKVHYQSSLLFKSIGYAHRGQWICNLKLINSKETQRSLIYRKPHLIKVKDKGAKGIGCLYDDHCASFNCSNDKCVCDAGEVESSPGNCSRAPVIGETCTKSIDCQRSVEDAQCLSPNKLVCQSNCKCQCLHGTIPIKLGFGHHRCMRKVSIGDVCERSAQCKVLNPRAYCGYDKRCIVNGNTYDQPIIKCSSNLDCELGHYCSSYRCRVFKTLGSSCHHDHECEQNAICNRKSKNCTCERGYKVSSFKKVCIPHNQCNIDPDCEKGFCLAGHCQNGSSLGERCRMNRQCQAIDQNSICDRRTKSCICDYPYQLSKSKPICIPESSCSGNEDCGSEDGGSCIHGRCVYPRLLFQECVSTDQCLMTTNFTICNGQCECLNPTSDVNQRQGKCSKERVCQSDRDCLPCSICDNNSYCSCLNYFKLNSDGFCYIMPYSEPFKDSVNDSLWISLLVFLTASMAMFIISYLSLKIPRKNIFKYFSRSQVNANQVENKTINQDESTH